MNVAPKSRPLIPTFGAEVLNVDLQEKCANGPVKRLRCRVIEICKAARWRSSFYIVGRTRPIYKTYSEFGCIQLEPHLMVRL
jgi:hypothetical protein